MHQPNETLRKSLHIAFGLFAFTLKWLPWWLAAAVAAMAVVGNWLLLHRIVGTRVSRHERGWDAGIVLYPLMVMLLIVVFREHLVLAAMAWAILAFGDGFATVVGRAIRIAPLPWNADKSWGGLFGFVVAALLAGAAVAAWFGDIRWSALIVAVFAAAVAESLPIHVDDNVTVPIAAAIALIVLSIEPVPYVAPPFTTVLLVANTILAILGWIAKTVDLSGFLGGWALGAIVILGAGWPLYASLLTFFIIGTACTRAGYARKARLGLAQEKEGRRDFGHAFSNVGVAAICAIAAGRSGALLPLMIGVASLATAAADTTASEIGQSAGRRAFLPLTFRAVPVGTEGAISVEGTATGVLAGAIVATVGTGLALGAGHLRMIGIITLCAFVGSYIESIAGSWNRKLATPVANGALNFFNTAVGAILFYAAWQFAV